MIRSFAHKGPEQFFHTGSKAGIQPKHAVILRHQLGVLNEARTPADMSIPGWGLHSLKGHLAGHFAVWGSKNWRLTFRFEGEYAVLIDYQDCH